MINTDTIDFLSLQFIDVLGRVKNVEVPKSQFDKALSGNIMFDGSSIEGFVRIEESDMFLVPDLETYTQIDIEKKTARIICDVYTEENGIKVPFKGCPRTILKKNYAEAQKLGYEMMVGPEMEFFLFNKENSPVDQGGYFDLGPSDSAEDVRREITKQLKGLGFEIEAMHHEVGPGQQEIDFRYDNPIKTADNVVTFKFIVKQLAKNKGFIASFMPKPLQNEAGSGMHCHQSLFWNDENLFYDEYTDDLLSDIAQWYIAGILKHAPALCFVTNPIVNSYKRLIPGYEAPVNICWSYSNRSPLIRIPARRKNGTRIELRNPDLSCNPYLAFTAMLAAGLDGIKNKLEPPKPILKNLFNLSAKEKKRAKIKNLPGSLYEALLAFKKDKVICDAFGEHTTNILIEAKTEEWKKYNRQIHKWEIERYLSC